MVPNSTLKRCILILLCCSLFWACSSSDSSDDTTSSDTTTDTSTDTHILSGTLSIEGANRKETSSPYIMIQNQETSAVYYTQVDSDGSFSVDIDATDSDTSDIYFIGLINDDPFEFAGPVVDYLSDDSSANSGIIIDADYSDIDITFDSDNSLASLSEDSPLAVADDYTLQLIDGAPSGVDSSGKGEASQTTTVSTTNLLDPDEDGVPNIFDAMDDGQNLDNTDADNAIAAVGDSSVATSAIMFMNYKIPVTDTELATITDNAIITIEVTVNDAAAIDSIIGHTVHSNYAAATISPFPVGFTEIDTYPATNSAWSDSSFSLYHAQNFDGDDIWTVFIAPGNNDFNTGDLIMLEATLTDGTSEYYWVSINFKFESFELVEDDTNFIFGGDGSVTDPYCILNTGGRVFYWSAPTDETGADLLGLQYDLELFYLYGTTPETTINPTDPQFYEIGEDVYYDNTTITEAVIDLYNDESPSTNVLQVDIKGSYEYGDNTALITFMSRENWNGSVSCVSDVDYGRH